MDGPEQRKPLKNQPLQVGMFFSNTNEDAYFETEDGDLCIPIVAETFVSFDGRVPHRTVVMSGHVDMVGPFSLSSNVLLNVAMGTNEAAPGGYKTQAVGNVVGIPGSPSRRELSTAENSGNIQGKLVVGDNTDKEKYPEDHFLKVNGAGLPSDCTDDCTMAIALANSRECTEDVHNSAQKVLLQPTLFYSTDEGGSTNGWFKQMIDNAESDSPVTLDEFFAAATGFTNTSASVVYLYDKEKSPVACAFLEPLTDEEKEKYDMMFNGEQQDNADAAAEQPAMGDGGGNGAGSVAFLPMFAVSSIMTCALLFLW
jgi:hypothetical protein